MLEGFLGAEHRRQGRSCAEPELLGRPGPGRTVLQQAAGWECGGRSSAPALSVKFPRGREQGGIVPKIHAGKQRLDENAAARPHESQGCLRCLLSAHLDTC